MAVEKQPKVILFDMGGVCVSNIHPSTKLYHRQSLTMTQVASPLQAILNYENTHNIPNGWINYSIAAESPNGSWHQLERGEIKLDTDFFASFKRDLQNSELWEQFHKKIQSQNAGSSSSLRPFSADTTSIPPVPDIDSETLFWDMMTQSRSPDSYVFPALRKLRSSQRYLLGALSNTVIFPPGHLFNTARADLDSNFDIFISSAHVGLRKPDLKIYHLAVQKLDALARERGDEEGVKAEDIVFLDDIGENLKAARSLGMRTIRVLLGRSQEAVRELEGVTGLRLLEEGEGEKARL